MKFIKAVTGSAMRAGLGLAIVVAAAATIPASALADAGSFLKSLEGKWSGNGYYRFEGRETDERISCRVLNEYDEAEGRLSLTGSCASAQIKNSMEGYLATDGDKVSGVLLGMLDGSRLTKSSGSVNGDRLVVLANFVDNATNTLYRSQQVIRRTDKGFEADLYWFDNKLGEFSKSGTIKFSSR